MGAHKTALGFVPGEVETGTHCMFIYPKRDDIFFERLAGYVKAGLDAGEMCVCACPHPDLLAANLSGNGVDADTARATGQLEIHAVNDVYQGLSAFDPARALDFWDTHIETARTRWKGIRIFGDADHRLDNRAVRLKILEYESRVNLSLGRVAVALCGYQSTSVPRTLMLQMKNVHPFVANTRSIRHNRRYMEPGRFLNAFYRFQRVSRVYTPTDDHRQQCLHHFEEIALRTPMPIADVEEMKLALGAAFGSALEHCCQISQAHAGHVHVSFLSEATGFTVQVCAHDPNQPSQLLSLRSAPVCRQ